MLIGYLRQKHTLFIKVYFEDFNKLLHEVPFAKCKEAEDILGSRKKREIVKANKPVRLFRHKSSRKLLD